MPNVTLKFGQLCLGLAHEKNVLEMRDESTGRIYHAARTTQHRDRRRRLRGARQPGGTRRERGARRAARSRLQGADDSAAATASPRSSANALHIWPRGGFMLIALPNPDAHVHRHAVPRAHRREQLRRRCATRAAVDAFFAREFPERARADARSRARLLRAPARLARHRLHARLASRWRRAAVRRCRARDRAVPRPGHELRVRGLRRARSGCMDEHHGWPGLFAAFEHARRPNTDAIAQMALENYVEMRDDGAGSGVPEEEGAGGRTRNGRTRTSSRAIRW